MLQDKKTNHKVFSENLRTMPLRHFAVSADSRSPRIPPDGTDWPGRRNFNFDFSSFMCYYP
jgi:hypothetical protein